MASRLQHWTIGLALTASTACALAYEDPSVKPEVLSLKNAPQNVLMVSNSYTYYNCGLFDYMWGFASDRKIPLQTQMATIAGADLDWHDVKRLMDPPGKSWSFIFKEK